MGASLAEKLKFVPEWYDHLIENGNEKFELAHFIKDHLLNCDTKKLLEIGMGTQPIFSEILAKHVAKYTIIEKEFIPNIRAPANVAIIQKDYEEAIIGGAFDLIILSHVIYYFSDLGKAIKKTLNLLRRNGKAVFVVNGIKNDYGLVKHAFAEISGRQFEFTYNRLLEAIRLQGLEFEEFTIETSIHFESYQVLYERLRLFFDLFPKEYSQNKNKVINWLKNNIKASKFFMDQKIIVVRNTYGC